MNGQIIETTPSQNIFDSLMSSQYEVVSIAAEYPPDYEIPAHRHQRAQFLTSVSGKVTVATPKKKWIVPPNFAIWLPSNTTHQICTHENACIRSLFLSKIENTELNESCKLVSVPRLLRELIAKFVSFPTEYKVNSVQGSLVSVLKDELKSLRETALVLPQTNDPRLNAITSVLLSDPSNDRTLSDWGRLVGASNRTLARLFILETGLSFKQWKQKCRILIGCQLLSESKSVTEAAFIVGYGSTSAFSVSFKDLTGLTPREYSYEYIRSTYVY